MGAQTARGGGDTGPDTVDTVVAVLLGTGLVAWRFVDWVATPARSAAMTLLEAVSGPAATGPTAERGRVLRAQLTTVAVGALQRAARQVLDAVLPGLDITELVLRYVDLDRLAAGLDLDAAVARVDLDSIVARIDLEAIVNRLDLDAVVARVDLAAIVDRIDVEAIASRIDLDRLAGDLDLQAIVDRLDLDAAAARLDADLVVARVDLDAIVRRIDLVGIAQSVIDAIDLPELVRESTGALSSDAVRAVRAEGRRADDKVAGLVDRLLRRSAADRASVLP
jgi:hypothetical protein